MDDSIRAEYQRRLNVGDRAGALAYLRMLRTQTDDSTERNAYTRAIDSIEGGGDGSDMAASSISTADSGESYGGSAGPFGDNPDEWAATHQPRHDSGVTAQAPAEAPAQPPVWAGPSTPPAAAPAPAPEHHGPSDPISEAIGGLQRGIHDRIFGHDPKEQGTAQAHTDAATRGKIADEDGRTTDSGDDSGGNVL